MKKTEFYSYKNPRFTPLREPMRGVMSAYGEAERYFATIKEVTWYKFGCKALTNYIHALEHIQPERVDDFKNIMAEYGLCVEYPATEELDMEQFYDLDKIFEVCVDIVNNIDEKLRAFIGNADEKHSEFSALARKAENLQMQNSEIRAFLLEAWAMWDNGGSETSFDNWVKEHAPYTNGGN